MVHPVAFQAEDLLSILLPACILELLNLLLIPMSMHFPGRKLTGKVLPEVQAIERYMTHLADMIKLSSRNMKWVDGNKHPGMLDYPGADIFGINFKGQPNVVAALRPAVEDGTPNRGLRLILELRRRIAQSNAFQAYEIVLAANLHCPDLAPIVVSLYSGQNLARQMTIDD